MGANEAPEKIYIQSFNVSEEDAKFERKLYFDDVWTEEPESGQENIEYTRTDTFIENTCEWIKMMWSETDDRFNEDYTGMLIENFKNYIKGE